MRTAFRCWMLFAALMGALMAVAPAHAGIEIITGDDDENIAQPSSRPIVFDQTPSDRMALVISIQTYDEERYRGLDTAHDDGDAVAGSLRPLGYRVMRIRDARNDPLSEGLATFAGAVTKDSTVVIYYNGIGAALPFERGNRIVPADFPADIPDTPSAAWRVVDGGTLPFQSGVLTQIKLGSPRVVIVFYDACLRDPLSGTTSMQRFSETQPCRPEALPEGAALYASSGETEGSKTVLAGAIVDALQANPALKLDALLTDIKRRVERSSNGTQSPVIRSEPSQSRDAADVCISPLNGACVDDSSGEKIALSVGDYVPESGETSDEDEADVAAILQVCDQLAAHPGNSENPEGVDGVLYGAMDGTKALPACLKAAKVAPDNLRIRYQLARAKQSAGQGEDAIKDLLKLAEDHQYSPAMNNLGATYQIGIGVPKSDGEAARWYRVAAEKGFVPSMAVLGYMYQAGRGVPKNNSEAFTWYQKAAVGGAPSAMHNLGFMYQNGWGTERDDAEAARWFEAAAEQDFLQAMAMAGWVYQVGRGVEQDTSKALKWYRTAADQGDPAAMSALGGLYDSGGIGLSRAPDDAAKWLISALRKGHQATRNRLIDQPKTLQPETRRAVQNQLQDLGFDPGPADGVFGQKTRDAIDEAFTAP